MLLANGKIVSHQESFSVRYRVALSLINQTIQVGFCKLNIQALVNIGGVCARADKVWHFSA